MAQKQQHIFEDVKLIRPVNTVVMEKPKNIVTTGYTQGNGSLLTPSSSTEFLDANESAPVSADIDDVIGRSTFNGDIHRRIQGNCREALDNIRDEGYYGDESTQASTRVNSPIESHITTTVINPQVQRANELDYVQKQIELLKALQNEEKELKQRQRNLAKHMRGNVKNIRRVSPEEATQTVDPRDFQRLDGSFDYLNYIKAECSLLFERNLSAAVDDQAELNHLSWETLRYNFNRINSITQGPRKALNRMKEISMWTNKAETAFYMVGFMYLWQKNSILQFLTCLIIVVLVVNGILAEVPSLKRTALYAKFREAYDIEPDFSELHIKEEQRNKEQKVKEEVENQSITDWLSQMRNEVLPWVQMMTGDVADQLEKLKNLLTWKVPTIAAAITLVLFSSLFASKIVPLPLLFRGLTLVAGIQFFILSPLQTHFPRYRRIFSPIQLLTWAIPTDAEVYVQDFVKLEDERQKVIEKRNNVKSYINTNDDDVQSMVSAASIDTFSTITDEDRKLKTLGDDQASIQSDTFKDAISYHPCTFRGFRGTLCLFADYLAFKPGHAASILPSTKARLAMTIPYDKVEQIKKKRHINLMPWHANALEIKLHDEPSVEFHNVVHRDDAFNTLVTFSGGRWKQV